MHDYLTLTLQGDHYSMGWQHGQQVRSLRSQVAEGIRSRLGQMLQHGRDSSFEVLVGETSELLRETDAPLIALIRGQAEALEFEFDTLLRYDLVTYLKDALPAISSKGAEGCTTWAATCSATTDGQPMLAKNRDYLLEDVCLQVVCSATPESGFRYVYVSSPGSPGVYSAGINQAGLAIADTYVPSTDLGPGLPDYALMMHVLEEHDDTASAVDYLRSVPRLGRNNLILVDARGHLVVFEIGHRTYGLLEADDGVLVNTNHFVSLEMQDCFLDVDSPQTKDHSLFRHKEATDRLDSFLGRIDVPFAQRLMAHHGGPLSSICRHAAAVGEWSTISASIFLPARRTMLFCHGAPCQGSYDEFTL